MGTLAFEVVIDGRVCKAPVDHIYPCFTNTIDETVIPDSQTNDAIASQESDKATSNVSEILVPRACIPTKRFIEEVD